MTDTEIDNFIKDSLDSTKGLPTKQRQDKLSEDLMSLVRMRKLTKDLYLSALNGANYD